MSGPWSATGCLANDVWQTLKVRAAFECCKWDIQREDHSVLAPYALVLDGAHWTVVAEMAERLTKEALALEREVLVRSDLHSHLGLPPPICGVLRDTTMRADTRAARVMRFDFHFTTEGWRISEVNSDVPGGFIESSGFAERLAEYYPGLRPVGNPSRAYSEAIRRLVGDGGHIALVHATAYSDDRQVMEYLAKHLRAQNLRTTLVSPAHLRFEHQRAVIHSRFASGSPDGLVRFFPAEWLPRLGRPSRWAGFFSGGATVLSNPGSALLLQTKRLPLVWDRLKSQTDMWRTLLPEVRCPTNIPEKERDEWVLKPAFGRVGEGVAIVDLTEPREFDRIARLAQRRPSGWVAQRRFRSVTVETSEGPRYPCLGVFTVDGCAAGCYGRVSAKPLTDADSQDVAVLIESENGTAT